MSVSGNEIGRSTCSRFRLGTISAAAAKFSIVVLLFLSPFLALTFFVCVVYAVVPTSLWKKHRSWKVRLPVAVTCLMGYGIIFAAVFLELGSLAETDSYWFVGSGSMTIALIAGFLFLPLAAVGSISTLLGSRRTRGES